MSPNLAVFPLDLVVFPGMTVPLHVFEARYKRLIRHTVELDRPRFVVARPRTPVTGEGRSLGDGEAQTVEEIGTLVDLLSANEQEDGSYRVLGHGRERCRVRVEHEESVAEPSGGERPLFYAPEEPYPLERGDPNEEQVAAWDALAAFRRYAEHFLAEQAREQAERAIPDDLLYQASFVCANLKLPPTDAQLLLEAATLRDRFEAARRAIERRLDGEGALGDEGPRPEPPGSEA